VVPSVVLVILESGPNHVCIYKSLVVPLFLSLCLSVLVELELTCMSYYLSTHVILTPVCALLDIKLR